MSNEIQILNYYVLFVLVLTGSWGILGVDCFFLISSYFLQNGKFKSKKLFYLILQIAFYAVPFFILYIIYQIYYIRDTNILHNIFEKIYKGIVVEPLFSNVYWFATTYIFLYLSFPFINTCISSLSKKRLHKFIIILTIIVPLYSMVKVSYTVLEDYAYAVYIYIANLFITRKE